MSDREVDGNWVAGRNAASRKNVRVCHLSSVHRANDIRVFHKECVTLAQAGFNVTLVAVAADVPPAGVKVVSLPPIGGRLTRMISGAWQAYSCALALRADIYHFHDPELLPYGLLLKRRTGARVIYDSHECYSDDIQTKEWLPAPLRRVVARAFGELESYVVRKLDLVVAATPHIDRFFRKMTPNVVTINNYPLRQEFGGARHDDKHKNSFCYVGAISFVRGIISVLDALDEVDAGIGFHLAGNFASPAVEAAAREHRNWSRVTFHGQVGRDEIARIYASSFAGIVTFLPERNHIFSQPNKLFEYMAAGLPVICSNFDLWRSMVDEGQSGLCVDPCSPGEIAQAINTLASDAKLCTRLSQNGQAMIRNRYMWEHEGALLVGIYDTLSHQ